MKINIRFGFLVSLFLLTGFGPVAHSACTTLINGAVAVDALSCIAVNPDAKFDKKDDRYSFVYQLDPALRKKFLDSYRGVLLKANVSRSKAVRTGLSKDKGVLVGETINLFVGPGEGSCEQLNGKKLAGVLNEICCDGGGSMPCLLDTGFVLRKPQILGASKPADGGRVKGKATVNSAEYKKGEAAFRAKKYKEAVENFELARQAEKIDINGYYMLSESYRNLEQCDRALPHLKFLQVQSENKDLWEQDRAVAQKGNFLYARCLARLGMASESVLVLNGYLIDPKLHKRELNEALKNSDFGYINSSKEYRQFRAEASRYLK